MTASKYPGVIRLLLLLPAALLLRSAVPAEAAELNSESRLSGALLSVSQGRRDVSGEDLTAADSDESVIFAESGAELSLTECRIIKQGGGSSRDLTLTAGRNAAVLSYGAAVNLSAVSIQSAAPLAPALFAAGGDSTVQVSRSEITTSGAYSSGMTAAASAGITASALSLATQDPNSPALEARSGGSISISDGELQTHAGHSPLVISGGSVSLHETRGMAGQSGIAVLGRGSTMTLSHSDLTCRSGEAVQLRPVQDDAGAQGIAVLTVSGGSLTSLSEDALIAVSGLRAVITLDGTHLNLNGGKLATVSTVRPDSPEGGDLLLNCSHMTMSGSISADHLSYAVLNLGPGTLFTGAVNPDGAAAGMTVTLSAAARWELTGNSRLEHLRLEDPSLGNISSNGFSISYNAGRCPELKGAVYPLPGGGRLEPAAYR